MAQSSRCYFLVSQTYELRSQPGHYCDINDMHATTYNTTFGHTPSLRSHHLGSNAELAAARMVSVNPERSTGRSNRAAVTRPPIPISAVPPEHCEKIMFGPDGTTLFSSRGSFTAQRSLYSSLCCKTIANESKRCSSHLRRFVGHPRHR